MGSFLGNIKVKANEASNNKQTTNPLLNSKNKKIKRIKNDKIRFFGKIKRIPWIF